MYTVGLESDTRAYFTGVTILISLPTGTKIFNWLSTYLGILPFLEFKTSSALFVLLFLLMFTVGGSTGVILGNAAVDLGLHDTYYVVAHFHFVLSLGAVIAIFSGSLFNVEKIIGKNYMYCKQKLYHVVLTLVGILLTFSPLHFLGFNVMPELLYERLFYSFTSFHFEAASGPFCLLINSSWLLAFTLSVFFSFLSGFNLYWWKGIYFSYLCLIFVSYLSIFVIIHFWNRDLLREFYKKYEVLLIYLFLLFFVFLISEALLFVSFFWAAFHSLSSPSFVIMPEEGIYCPDPCELTFANTLILSNAAISLGNAFISLEISSSFNIYFILLSLILASTFVGLQIKEFRIMGLSINDSVYSCLFYFCTGLHFFHLLIGLLLLGLMFWSCSFVSEMK
jgi:hypothetical protein